MPKASFIVTFELPDGATLSAARNYVLDSVSTWCGSLEPSNADNDYSGNPMFDLDSGTVRVSHRKCPN